MPAAGHQRPALQLNFFGAVATLEGLRPLLKGSPAPRAVVVSSIASFESGRSTNRRSLSKYGRTCRQSPPREDAIAPRERGPLDLYGSAKHALNRWCRRAAVKPEWAGAGIPLNVVAPGFIDTPAAAYIFVGPGKKRRDGTDGTDARRHIPVVLSRWPPLLAWCVSPENSLMTGTNPLRGWWCRVFDARRAFLVSNALNLKPSAAHAVRQYLLRDRIDRLWRASDHPHFRSPAVFQSGGRAAGRVGRRRDDGDADLRCDLRSADRRMVGSHPLAMGPAPSVHVRLRDSGRGRILLPVRSPARMVAELIC